MLGAFEKVCEGPGCGERRGQRCGERRGERDAIAREMVGVDDGLSAALDVAGMGRGKDGRKRGSGSGGSKSNLLGVGGAGPGARRSTMHAGALAGGAGASSATDTSRSSVIPSASPFDRLTPAPSQAKPASAMWLALCPGFKGWTNRRRRVLRDSMTRQFPILKVLSDGTMISRISDRH